MLRMTLVVPLPVFLICTTSALAADGLSMADCRPQTMKIVKTRLFQSKGTLHPLIFSRDVLHLSACEGLGSRSSAHQIEQALDKNYVLEKREITIAEKDMNPLTPAARDACNGEIPCKVEIYRRKNFKVRQVIPFAKSGGLPFSKFLGHLGAAGIRHDCR